MPKPDYNHQATVLVGCSGPAGAPDAGTGPAGAFASKASAHLKYAIADVERWEHHMSGPSPIGKNCLQDAVLLPEATRGEVLAAVAEASAQLNAHKDHSRGGSLNLCYSGHGLPNGDLCLADGPLSPNDLADAVTEGYAGGQSRQLRVMLDSCHYLTNGPPARPRHGQRPRRVCDRPRALRHRARLPRLGAGRTG